MAPSADERRGKEDTEGREPLHVRTFVLGEFGANCFVVWQDPEAAGIVDPGADPDPVLDFLQRRHMRVAFYLLTHGHMDHIGALTTLARDYPAPYAITEADLAWAFDDANAWEPYYPAPKKPAGATLRRVSEGDVLRLGEVDIHVLHTPGHTPGSVCYHIPSAAFLFSGDTLFAGSVGRTDLAGGSPEAMQASLERLCALPADTRIYPGHGPATRLRDELRTNPFLQRM